MRRRRRKRVGRPRGIGDIGGTRQGRPRRDDVIAAPGALMSRRRTRAAGHESPGPRCALARGAHAARPTGGSQQLLLVGLLACAAAASLAAPQIVSDEPNSVIIKTNQGQLFRGARLPPTGSGAAGSDRDVVAFLGVRYASAPVKRLRFMPPAPFSYARQAANGSQAVHDLRQFGPICIQRLPMEPAGGADERPAAAGELRAALMARLLAPRELRAWQPLVRQLASLGQSEDCLNLNIYTPIEALKRGEPGGEPAAERPVLVLVHGGSFDFGAGSALDGRAFARNNRVLVITLNYRLHILGFPPRPAGAARANLGLLDQVAALHWIQANVRAFGGSPSRVTLMGSKGGAVFVHLLMLSPLAKGLFQRAVLEDGTALSPVIANNMALAGPSQAQAARQQVAASAGLQHLRLLGQLNDCPARAADTPGQQPATSGDDERASPALLIECLRARPAEAIGRHWPVELIDLSRPVSRAAIPLAPRWLRPLEQTLELLIKEELKSQLDEPADRGQGGGAADSRRAQLEELKRLLATAAADQTAALLDQQRLDTLIRLMINRFVAPAGAPDDDAARLTALLAELLGAIYLPSNKTLPVGPVFAPQLEPGLISAGDEPDLASQMLQRGSPFNRRDLLIGLTHPLVDLGADEQAAESAASFLVPGLASRRLLELGLTEEQALGQVNQLVRSFFRFHQQEVSNSIISQYLGRKSGGLARAAAGGRPDESLGALDQLAAARVQKQLFLAAAMRALYRDALVDVPLVKSGLIHSLQQLDSLAHLFVAEQMNKLDGATQDEELERFGDERRLEEEFHQFARSFVQDPAIWPVRLVPPSRVQDAGARELFEQSQPRSTYLFQFLNNFDWLRPHMRAAIARLDSRAPSPRPEVQTVLAKMAAELDSEQSPPAPDPFECHFGSLVEGHDIASEDEAASGGASLLDAFRGWICRRQTNEMLANFVETGNINHGHSGLGAMGRREALGSRYESDCRHSHESSLAHTEDDHHLVKLAGVSESRSSPSLEPTETHAKPHCHRLVQQLAFEELAQELNLAGEQRDKWPVFNVFSQQLASFFAPGHLERAIDSLIAAPPEATSQPREAFDAKVAFWANFVAALNCSKTQPIGASSLSLFSQANSTLLNMNLNLNCQQAGASWTANSMLQSIGARIRQEIRQQVAARRRASAAKAGKARNQLVVNLSSSQNHHSLRMANMSSNQGQTSLLEGGADLGEPGGHWSVAGTSEHARRFYHQLSPAGVRLVAGGFAAGIATILGVVVMLLRHRQRGGRDPKPPGAESDSGEQPDWSSAGLQRDVAAGFLEESATGPGLDELCSQSQSASFVPNGADDSKLAGQEFPMQGLELGPHQTGPSHHALLNVHVGSHQHLDHAAAELAAQPDTHYVRAHPGSRPLNLSRLSVAPSAEAGDERHLPNCNLLVMQHQHQQPHLLSSSSETTTTTTNTLRAQSSVSLVSNSSKKPAGKKRVKISDPRRMPDAPDRPVYSAEGVALFELDARQLDHLAESPHYCPIHRSNSSLTLLQPAGGQYLIDDGAAKYQLLSNGHQSLLRHQSGQQHMRALALNAAYLDGSYAPGGQTQVCPAHNFEQQQQVIFADGFCAPPRKDQPELLWKDLSN